MISKDRCRIAVGDLEAEDTGGDETQERDEREEDNMLITSPAERVLGLHQFKKSVEGECSQNKEMGDKHRRKKYINPSTGSLVQRRCYNSKAMQR